MMGKMVLRASSALVGLDVLDGEIAYISHAHSDHSEAVGGPLKIFCTDATADLLGIRYAGRQEEFLNAQDNQADITQTGMEEKTKTARKLKFLFKINLLIL